MKKTSLENVIASTPLPFDDEPFPEVEMRSTEPAKRIAPAFDLEEFGARTPGGVGPVRRWKNPTDVPVTFEVSIPPVTRAERVKSSLCLRRVVIPAGAIIELPRAFDRCIHRVHGREIIGGSAPQLVAIDLPPARRPQVPDAYRDGFAHTLLPEASK